MSPLAPQPEVIDFLLTRRSRPAKTLRAPAPDRTTLERLLQAALRVPDHGKLEPWRLAVLEGAALTRLGDLTERLGAAQGRDPERVAKSRAMFDAAPLMVAVISTPVTSEKIPEIEQTLSAGAVCLGLVNMALASGWGANWLTGWMATNRPWLSEGLGLDAPDFVAGLIVLGTETSVPPDRPRPDLSKKVDWIST